jgi:dTDP-4-amino-4,6-dideoxygalactose transaminase
MITERVQSELAISGGRPVRTRPFPAWPHFSEQEIEAVAAVLRSGRVNYWTGNEGREFEKEFAALVNCRHAIALANGTVALELALYALGIGPGDEVIVPSRTFIATASCALMRGAVPVFADVDLQSGNLTHQTVRPLINRRTKAIIAVHLAGWPCDMDPLLALAQKHQLKVIEDCAQAHGSLYKGRMVGSMGHAAAFSFCQDKIISTGGEGGMLTTNAEQVWQRAWSFKDHGKSYEAMHSRTGAVPGFRWVHEEPGTNWRLTEMQSAIGRVLLPKIPERVERRQLHAARLNQHFAGIPALRIASPPADARHAYYKYYVYIRPKRLNSSWNRDRVVSAICAEGIPCAVGSCSEIYLEKAIPANLRPGARCPVARELGETSLMFPLHHRLAEEDIADIAEAVEKVMKNASVATPPATGSDLSARSESCTARSASHTTPS